jgi:hypothetical protein
MPNNITNFTKRGKSEGVARKAARNASPSQSNSQRPELYLPGSGATFAKHDLQEQPARLKLLIQ